MSKESTLFKDSKESLYIQKPNGQLLKIDAIKHDMIHHYILKNCQKIQEEYQTLNAGKKFVPTLPKYYMTNESWLDICKEAKVDPDKTNQIRIVFSSNKPLFVFVNK